MTLDTRVAIGAPTDVMELFQFCRELLGTPKGTPFTHEACSADWRPGQREIHNPGGIGLPAWLWIYYGADGPLPVHEHDEFCAIEGNDYGATAEDEAHHLAEIAADPTDNGWAVIEVSFDTAYGYRGANGETCSDLHARLVTALGQWLDAKGLPWKWYDEYQGTWHEPDDGRLQEFGNAHRSTGADSWFTNVVRPLIESGRLA